MNAKKSFTSIVTVCMLFVLAVFSFGFAEAQDDTCAISGITQDGTLQFTGTCSPADMGRLYAEFQAGMAGDQAVQAMPTPTISVVPADINAARNGEPEIDKLNTFDQGNNLWVAEAGGEREQMIEMYNAGGQSTVIYLIAPLQPNESAARWQMWGSRWEITETGENIGFDLFKNAVTYFVDRHSRGENVSGLIVDLRSGTPVLVSNLFGLSDSQINTLLNAHAVTMAGELTNGWTVNLIVSLDGSGNPVYTGGSQAVVVGAQAQTNVVCVVSRVDSGNVNLSTGPGQNFPSPYQISQGTTLAATGRNTDSSWWQVSYAGTNGNVTSLWLSADVVTETGQCELLPVVSAPAAPTAVAQATQVIPTTIPQAALATPTGQTGFIGREGDADGATYGKVTANDKFTYDTTTKAYLIESWQAPGTTGDVIIIVPVGVNYSGAKGANWAYGSTTGATADAMTKGKPIYTVGADGKLVPFGGG